MTTHLLVASRKGLFVYEHIDAGWQLARTAFLGDHVCQVLADPRDGRWYAVLDLGHFGTKLQRSADQGRSWQELAVPAYGSDDEVIMGDGKAPRPATLVKLWELVAGGADQPGRLWAGTIPGGLFRSDDCGESWTLNRPLWDRPERKEWFGGGYDEPGIHSICVDPRDARRLTVAISTGGVWRSEDDGASWCSSARGMHNLYMPPERRDDEVTQDVHRMVQCKSVPEVYWVQHHNTVFLSRDGAASWQEVPTVQPSVFGFAAVVDPAAPGTAWFVPAVKDEQRYPVDGRLVVARTRDFGSHFEVLDRGLPSEPAYDLVYRHALAIDRGGHWLAMGSTTGGLWLSADHGDQWELQPQRLPPIFALSFA
jgi:hypothetical protein